MWQCGHARILLILPNRRFRELFTSIFLSGLERAAKNNLKSSPPETNWIHAQGLGAIESN
jgi:hypothetical protein